MSILYSKGRLKPPLTPLTDGQWLRNGKEINQEEEEKKNLWTKDMIDVKTMEWEGNKTRKKKKKKPLDKGYD